MVSVYIIYTRFCSHSINRQWTRPYALMIASEVTAKRRCFDLFSLPHRLLC